MTKTFEEFSDQSDNKLEYSEEEQDFGETNQTQNPESDNSGSDESG